MAEKQTLICDRCKVEMTPAEVQFTYLGTSVQHKVPRCPECGQVYISEELVESKMHQLEGTLEEK